jgi:threonine dehydrogenase-like Zn-dependent dehydrogenase
LRAAVLVPGDGPWSLRITDDWPEPVAGPGQLVVRVRGVGVCGSDLALLSGQRLPPSSPWVPGHEAFGEVVAAGPGVPRARLGERVVIEPNIPCLACPPCQAGLTSGCLDRVSLGYNAPGVLAERIAVPAGFAWPVPADWSDEDAVCAEPLTVALAAIRRVGGIGVPGRSGGAGGAGGCLVIGAGSQGLLMCVALVAAGLTPSVLEPHDGRRSLAATLGARPAGPGDGGFGVVFETSGSASAIGEAVGRAALEATVVLIGLPGDLVPVDLQTVVRHQLRVQGSLTYDHPGDFAATLTSTIRPAPVLRARYPLPQAPQAFRNARTAPGKTWITLPS